MKNLTWVLSSISVLVFSAAACSSGEGGRDTVKGGPGSGGGSGGSTISVGTGGGGGGGGLDLPSGEILVPSCESNCQDFPEAPIVDDGVTGEQVTTLDEPGSGTGPCVMEPANGTIFPANWTRPRFLAEGSGSGPYKITLSAAKEEHDLRVYTARLPYYLPQDIWDGLSLNVHDEDITYTIRSVDGSESTGTFKIAPVAAGGSMVFWGSTGTEPGAMTNALYGFGVGDEGVISALVPGNLTGVAVVGNGDLRMEYTDSPGQSTCVGCHSSTPDGRAVATVDHWPWNVRLSSIEDGTRGQSPDYLTPAGAAMISMSWLGGTTFSNADWAKDQRRMVTTWSYRDISGGNIWRTHDGSVLSLEPTELVWMDLANAAPVSPDLRTATPDDYDNNGQLLQNAVGDLRGVGWDVIAREGDPNSPVMADWSHDGSTIVYTSTDQPQDGRVGGATVADIYTVPFAGGAGGEAKPLAGADSGDFEYYPDYSPDDSLVAFNRLPFFETNPGREDSFDHVYYRPDSDIYVVPAAGGEAVRLASNDVACASEGTAGALYNSWAKWAPSTASDGEKTYYFLIFSTARNSPLEISRGQGRFSPASQLYMTTVIKHADGTIESSPAIYLWNQRNLVDAQGNTTELGTNNVTPAWDEFKIPPVPPVVIR